jgi:YrbI family 3-deoxy-D-manno-octulosonate 8-phosphate phosphatase
MKIKLVVFDFDGVFTDGIIQFDNQGNIIKKYNCKDGTGIKLLQKNNIKVGVISGYKDNISQRSILEHLGIELISLGSNNKIIILTEWCNNLDIKLNEVAYMGDDVNDLELLNNVKLSGCPNNAHKQCISVCNFISKFNGGEGCVRDFCDNILDNYNFENKNNDIISFIKQEVNYQIDNFNISEIENLCNIILNTNKNNNIYFSGIGKSENIAKHCCELLKSISIKSFFINPTNLLHGDIGTIMKDDLIILFSNSGNTKELISIIPILKDKKCKICGICCNNNSKFKEICDIVIITPFRKEVYGEIDYIPTNSSMSHLLFTNILVFKLIELSKISLIKYKSNHPAGNIGSHLQIIRDLIKFDKYPKFILKDKIDLKDILLQMTNYRIACCIFCNENDDLLGILTDYDIRQLLLINRSLKYITSDNINKNYYYETDLNKFISQCNKKNKYCPVLNNKKIIGLIEFYPPYSNE